jgi:hypothetical protein
LVAISRARRPVASTENDTVDEGPRQRLRRIDQLAGDQQLHDALAPDLERLAVLVGLVTAIDGP